MYESGFDLLLLLAAFSVLTNTGNYFHSMLIWFCGTLIYGLVLVGLSEHYGWLDIIIKPFAGAGFFLLIAHIEKPRLWWLTAVLGGLTLLLL